jgi:uncharacterized membrane-anchored protein
VVGNSAPVDVAGIASAYRRAHYRARMQAMHVLLAVSALIILGLAVWLAVQIVTGEKSPHVED